MSLKPQHEIHPDVEALSAFAEQALSAKERGDVLKHLALCSHCREIVALAGEAAGAEVAAPRHEVARPRAWWRSWGLALGPAVAVVATAVMAIYVHERDVERKVDVARLEQLRASEKAPMPPQASPQQAAQAAPPATPRRAPAKIRTSEPLAAAPRPPSAEPDETAAAPPPEVMSGLLSRREEQAERSGLERHRSDHEAFDRAETAPNNAPSEAALYDEERKKESVEEAEHKHQFAAKAPTPRSEHDSESVAPGSSGGGSTEPADVSAQQYEMQSARTANSLQLHGMRSMVNVPTGGYGYHLPSGRPAVSIVSANHLTLAIDEKGLLFVREDSEGTWQKVKRQWTGRATVVRRQARESGANAPLPAPETAANAPASGAVSESDTAFELINDQSQVWISEDGRIWTAK